MSLAVGQRPPLSFVRDAYVCTLPVKVWEESNSLHEVISGGDEITYLLVHRFYGRSCEKGLSPFSFTKGEVCKMIVFI